MKILVADDQTRRYGRLVERLGSLGIAEGDVHFAVSANDARTRMEVTQYDLLLLDVLFPLWAHSDPEVRHSLELLMELHDASTLMRPGRILGITADREIANEVSREFEDRLWTLIEYSEFSDAWLNKVMNCVKYVVDQKSGNASAPASLVDLAVVCALPKPELEAVLDLPWNWSAARPVDDVLFVYDGYFFSSDRGISVCATAAPRMGMVATALRSAALIQSLRPKLLAMCGICAGVRGKVNVGDVLFADPSWDFQSGKRIKDTEGARFAIAPHQLAPPSSIRSHVEQLRADNVAMTEIAAGFKGAPAIPKIVIGPVASGSAVLADGEIVQEILRQHRELIGVEMEVYGLYAAAANASAPAPASFALKGVCDFADPNKGDDHQRFAAFTSANMLRLLMERFGDRLV